MDTYNLVMLTFEQNRFMSDLFVAIRNEAEKAQNSLIAGLATQGLYWAESNMNELDCERERLEPEINARAAE